MPHTFRTIEEFVLLLEKRKVECAQAGTQVVHEGYEDGVYAGQFIAFEEVLKILHTSNLGIVIPPEDM